jgi:hypothetical protein
VADGLDVVAVGIPHEGAKVAGVIFRPKPRCVQLLGAQLQGFGMELPHGGGIRAEEGPGSEGQDGGQQPPGATRGTVPQKTDRPGRASDRGKGETVV